MSYQINERTETPASSRIRSYNLTDYKTDRTGPGPTEDIRYDSAKRDAMSTGGRIDPGKVCSGLGKKAYGHLNELRVLAIELNLDEEELRRVVKKRFESVYGSRDGKAREFDEFQWYARLGMNNGQNHGEIH